MRIVIDTGAEGIPELALPVRLAADTLPAQSAGSAPDGGAPATAVAVPGAFMPGVEMPTHDGGAAPQGQEPASQPDPGMHGTDDAPINAGPARGM